MGNTTIRIPDATHAALQQLAREQFLAGLNEDYARLRADPAAWADWQAELSSLDGTLLDGIADDPWVE